MSRVIDRHWNSETRKYLVTPQWFLVLLAVNGGQQRGTNYIQRISERVPHLSYSAVHTNIERLIAAGLVSKLKTMGRSYIALTELGQVVRDALVELYYNSPEEVYEETD